MTKFAFIFLMAASVALPAATPAAKKKTSAKKPAVAAAPAATPLTIPAEATPHSDGSFSYTDKQGKKWIFRKTPFGLSRVEDMSVASQEAPASSTGAFITATDAGETVKFVRKTPFGDTRWEKKKAELNDEERAALSRVTNAQPAASSQSNPPQGNQQ